MEGTRLVASGPDLFCPDCKRWLVRIHDDGTWDLAADAGVQWAMDMEDFNPFSPPEEVEAVPHEAVCLRRRCRFTRWRQRARSIERPLKISIGANIVATAGIVLAAVGPSPWPPLSYLPLVLAYPNAILYWLQYQQLKDL